MDSLKRVLNVVVGDYDSHINCGQPKESDVVGGGGGGGDYDSHINCGQPKESVVVGGGGGGYDIHINCGQPKESDECCCGGLRHSHKLWTA